MYKLKHTITAMVLLAAAAVQAETLALWENDNLTAPANSTPVDVVSTNNTTAGDLELGPGFSAPGTTWPNALDTGLNANATNLAAAIANSHYFSFTVEPVAGKQIDYSNVVSRITINALTNIGTSVQMVLMSSATGFTDGDEIGSFVATTPDNSATDNGLIALDVSSVSNLQDQASAVEFRLYAVLAGTPGSYNRLALGHIFFEDGADDVRVDGTVEDATSLPVVALAQWDLDGTAASSTTAPVDMVHSNMSSSSLDASANLSTSIGWPDALGCFAENWRLSSSLEYALSVSNYFSFTLTPDAGKQVSYDNLAARFAVNCSGSTDVKFHLLSSQTGFSTNSVLDSFNVVDSVTNYTPTIYAHTFDLGSSGLTNITGATEFRIYVTSANGNRIGIGHTWSAADPDDLVVSGTIGDAPIPDILPPDIIGWTQVSNNVMKLVVNAPSSANLYFPENRTDLAIGSWTNVAHSDDGVNAFIITNLSYSTAEGTNEVIYVQSNDAQEFFRIKGVQ